MSPKLPVINSKKVIAALQKAGFVIHHTKGSHVSLKHPESSIRIVVPHHGRDMSPGTLHNIIKQAQLTREEFLDLL